MDIKASPRVIVLCVFRRDDMIFVAENFNPIINGNTYRPVGGGIEFGETSADAIRREVMEEIEAEITNIAYLGTIENIFMVKGNLGHEIVLVYDASFVDETCNQDDYIAHGNDNGVSDFIAMWKPLSYFREGHAPLYPGDLLHLLDSLRKDL